MMVNSPFSGAHLQADYAENLCCVCVIDIFRQEQLTTC